MAAKIYILIIVMLLLAGMAHADNQSCGCAVGLDDGLNAARGYTLCLLVETPAFSGTADSMVFLVKDLDDNGDDTVYVAVFTMDTDSSVKDLVALSVDSIMVTDGTQYVAKVLALAGEAIAASTAYHLCITCRGTATNTRWDACNDNGASENTGVGTDAWPLEDPSSLAFDTDYYAPNVVLWYTSEGGEAVSVGGLRRRKIIIGQ